MNSTNCMIEKNILIIWTFIGFSTTFLGGFGNIWFSFLVYRNYWNKINYRILFWIMILDISCDLVFIPFEVLQTYWYFEFNSLLGTTLFCQIESLFFNISLMGSIFGKFVAASVRGWSIFFPISYRKFVSMRFINIIIATLIFGFSTLIHLAFFKWALEYDMDPVFGDCYSIHHFKWTDVLRSSIFTYFPLTASFLIYLLIFLKIIFMKSSEKGEIMKLTKGSGAVFCSIIIYGACVLPLWIGYDSSNHYNKMSWSIWNKFIFRFSYAIDPLFYLALDSNMRRATLKYFKKSEEKL